jgi:phospholipid/cholesterol/gamma-HCH transport system substrate-binding protein
MGRRDKNVRVELTRRDYARRGLVTILAIALVLVVLAFRSSGVIGGPDEVSAQLADAGGSLGDGADVKLRGVIIGRVSDVARGPDGGVRVRLALSGGQLGHIPANVVARILPATVFGTSYVDLTTRGPASGQLHAGAVIPADRSQGTLELQQALDDIDELVKALRPAQLNTTLSAIATALDGRGDEIGGIVTDLDTLLRNVEPKVPLIQSDIAKLATNLDLVRQTAPQVLDGVQDSLSTLHTIVAQKAALSSLLTGGRSVLAEADTFLGKVRPDLVTFLQDAAIVTDVYHDLRRQAFTDAFTVLRRVQQKLSTVIHHGWADNTLIIQQQPPPYYTSADCPQFGAARGDNCRGLGRAGVSSMLGGAGGGG